MKLTIPINTTNLDPEDPLFSQFITQLFDQILTVLNGEIGFTDNCKVSLATCVFNTPNVEQAFTHNLNKIPSGYIQMGSVLAAQVYDGVSKNTNQIFYLRSSVATTVRLLIF